MAETATIVEPDVLVEQKGAIGHIELNRPKAMNSLTLGMVRTMSEALETFATDPRVAAIVLTGAGERGLCAGGDIRAIHDSGKAGTALAESFWREEYRLNALIAHLKKPYVAIMDGITMGGGVGVAAYGSHRVVTEKTLLAMPETGIGFVPDVGASWFLSHAPGELGTYLGLTGQGVGAADAIEAGLADVFVPTARLPALYEALSALSADSSAERIGRTIQSFAEEAPAGKLGVNRALIDRAFCHDSVEAILAALGDDGSEFATATARTIAAKSPTTLKATLRLLRAGRASDTIEQCLNREFDAVIACLGLPDFYEGIRAAVIDKDRNPRWSPASLDGVTEAMIAPFFIQQDQPPFART
jgi:enoyl-CoA hydratase